MKTKVERAHDLIEVAFSQKVDKGGVPYVLHCRHVHDTVVQWVGENPDLQCIALLHDVLEDCPQWSYAALKKEFGRPIAIGVHLLTREPGENYGEYIESLLPYRDVCIVKLADLKNNMDVTRLSFGITDNDIYRLRKYHKAYKDIIAAWPEFRRFLRI